MEQSDQRRKRVLSYDEAMEEIENRKRKRYYVLRPLVVLTIIAAIVAAIINHML